jgi:hypothetical protein
VRLNVFGKRMAALLPSQAMGAVLPTFTPRYETHDVGDSDQA